MRICRTCAALALSLSLLVSACAAPVEPILSATNAPAASPSAAADAPTPTASPTASPAPTPTAAPTASPTTSPAPTPTAAPSASPAASGSPLTEGEASGLTYLLYAPAGEDLPLVVYLHGGSGRGDDLSLLLEAESLPKFLEEGELAPKALVLMPQLPKSMNGWSEAASDLDGLIDEIVQAYDADPSRVSLTGHSMGGTGAFAVAAALPDRFSRAAPLSGSVRDTRDTRQALSDLPLWAFAGSKDTVVDPAASEAFVQALHVVNPDARFTLLRGVDHFGVPAEAFLREDLLDWLTA